jgi:hypothetical protein
MAAKKSWGRKEPQNIEQGISNDELLHPPYAFEIPGLFNIRIALHIRVYSRPFAVHQSKFTIHHSPFTIHHSPFTMHHAPCTMHHAPCTIHHSPHSLRQSKFLVRHSTFVCFRLLLW